jgi:putative ABC transport system permease protein
VAAAVLVLCGAGLLLRTLLVIDGSDQGYRAERERVLTSDFVLPGSRYATPESQIQFYDAIEEKVMALPDVHSAGWASTLPLGGSQLGRQSFDIVGDPPLRDDTRPQADFQIVSPGYFRTLDLPIVAGRAFSDDDPAGGTAVCIVSEGFVRRHLAGRNPIGVRIRLGGAPADREIIGVARQVKERPDELEDLVQIYVPNSQVPWPEAYLLVRARNASGDALTPAIRQAIARVDKQLAVRSVVTLADVASEATARHRFRAVLVSTFAALALLLAIVGVFGVLAYSVQQRWREFGVRMALGASARNVFGLVAASAARLIAVGTVIGLSAAAALAQLISAFLFGVQPLDPVTYASVAAVIAVTAGAATAAPAIRATRVDPAVTFRAE